MQSEPPSVSVVLLTLLKLEFNKWIILIGKLLLFKLQLLIRHFQRLPSYGTDSVIQEVVSLAISRLTYRTDSNCQGNIYPRNICPRNICPRDICPYQEYLGTWLCRNFKDRLLGTSWTDSNSHVDICPGNICSGDICTFQKDLSCYWHDLD